MTIPFLQIRPRSIKLKVSPRFPAQLIGRTGIAVTKANGSYFLDLNYSMFPPLSVLPPPDVANLYTLLYNIVTKQFELVQINQIGGGGSGGGIPEAPIDGLTYGRNATTWTQVLALSGGVLSGPLVLAGDPTVAFGAATKQYVDARAYIDAPIDGNIYGRRSGTWSIALGIAGGTLTGPLTLAADPTSGLQAATKQYADAHPFPDAANDGFFYARMNGTWAKVLGLAGGTLAGPLILATDPSVAYQAATKNYVDNAVASGGGGTGIPDAPSDGTSYGRRNAAWVQVLALSGGTMTGALLLQGDPTTNLGAATKQYVDSHGGLVDAPNDGSAYGRLNTTWAKVLPLAGGTLTGPVVLAADPAVALGAATKQYVDAHTFVDAPNDGSTYGRKNLGWSKALDLTGGTLTGPLILAADPTAVLGAATKQYVDTRVRYDIAQGLTSPQQAQARSNIGAGTASVQNTGTSGANVPLLNTANTWSLTQTNVQGWDAAIGTGYSLGGVITIMASATYTFIRDPSGRNALYFGNTGDAANYADNDIHYFRDRNSTFRVQIKNTQGLNPVTDNSIPCGGPSNRWTLIYAASSTINTSDADEKRMLAPPDDAVFEAILAVPMTFYQWQEAIERKGVDGARLHYGPTAQAVRDELIKHGIDPTRLALFCVDPVFENEYYEEDGNTKLRTIETGTTRLGLRLDQFDRLRTEALRRKLLKDG